MAGPQNQTLHYRKMGSVPFVAGGRQTIELDRDQILMGLSLRLQYTMTNGVSGPVGPKFQAIARLIRRLEIIAGGRDTVWSVNAEHLTARLQYERGQPAFGMDDTFVLTNSAVTIYDIVIPLDFTLPKGRRPDDTGLDTRGLNQLTLSVTWGDVDDLVTTVNGATVGAVTFAVEGRYLLNVPPKAAFLVRALDTKERDLTGTTDNFDLVMDRGTGLIYRSFNIFTLANDIGVDTILGPGSIRVESGSFIFQNRDAAMVQGDNRVDLGQDSLIAGSYFIDLLHQGQLVTGLNTSNLDSDLKLILDATKVAGTNSIQVQREAVRPLKLS